MLQPPDHFCGLLWVCSESSTITHNFCAGDTRAGRSSAGGISQGQGRWAQSPPFTCCSWSFGCSPGCGWISELQGHIVGSSPVFPPPEPSSSSQGSSKWVSVCTLRMSKLRGGICICWTSWGSYGPTDLQRNPIYCAGGMTTSMVWCFGPWIASSLCSTEGSAWLLLVLTEHWARAWLKTLSLYPLEIFEFSKKHPRSSSGSWTARDQVQDFSFQAGVE